MQHESLKRKKNICSLTTPTVNKIQILQFKSLHCILNHSDSLSPVVNILCSNVYKKPRFDSYSILNHSKFFNALLLECTYL